MPDDFVPQLSITVGGRELPEHFYDCLTEARVECSVQLPDQVRLAFIDPDFELYDRDFWSAGDQVEVSITSDGRPRPITTAQVTTIGMEPDSNGSMMLTITALGIDHQLYRGVRLASYVDQTDSEIVAALASDCGLTADIDSSSIRHPHVMQAGPANRFLDSRARLIGYRWWVDGTTLHFKNAPPDSTGPVLSWGEDLLSLRVVSSTAEATGSATVRSWDPDLQKAIATTSTSRPDMALLGTDATGPTAVATKSRRLNAGIRFSANQPTDDISAASALADGICQRAAATEVVIRGVALGNPAIRAGSKVRIENVGRKLSGTYRLAAVEHVYTAADGYVTRFSSGGQDPTELVDLLRGTGETPPWNPHSLVIGVVTNVEDPERPARVKVNFPTFHDTYESAWARLVLPGAGPGRGLQIYPEVDDEVLVGFENGDPQRPVVLGGMWSRKWQPPLATKDVVKNGMIGSRSWKSRAGHSITINDAEADTPDSIVIALKDGKTVLTVAADRVTLTSPSDISINSDRGLALKAKGDLSIEGANITVKATSNLDLKAVELAAQADAAAKFGGGMVTIKSSSTLSLDGGAATEIKGGMVNLN